MELATLVSILIKSRMSFFVISILPLLEQKVFLYLLICPSLPPVRS